MRASRGLKWENKMYKPKRSIHLSFSFIHFFFFFFPVVGTKSGKGWRRLWEDFQNDSEGNCKVWGKKQNDRPFLDISLACLWNVLLNVTFNRRHGAFQLTAIVVLNLRHRSPNEIDASPVFLCSTEKPSERLPWRNDQVPGSHDGQPATGLFLLPEGFWWEVHNSSH